jgi:hypothetical protein
MFFTAKPGNTTEIITEDGHTGYVADDMREPGSEDWVSVRFDHDGELCDCEWRTLMPNNTGEPR